MYHGWSDQDIAPRASVNFFRRTIEATTAAPGKPDWVRLFMVPGMGHCGGGEGPNTFDMIGALERWVENGSAPDRIIATHSTNGKPDRKPREHGRDPERETRRPRHTKPNPRDGVPYAKLILSAGRREGIEPADVVSVVVDNSHLENDDVRNVKVLERFAFVEVPAERAGQVADAVSGNEVRGTSLRAEVTQRS